jgi:hypothetical protein
MDVWDRINDTLDVVAWPLVVAIVAFIFRHELRRMVGRVRKVQTAVVGFDLEAAAAEFSEDYQRASELLAPASVDDPAAPEAGDEYRSGDVGDGGEGPESAPDRDASDPKRAVLDEVVDSATRYGYTAAAVAAVPASATPDGNDLVSSMTRMLRKLYPDWRVEANRIAEEIRRLESRIDWSPGDRAVIDRLRARLRELDPTNPYANI